MHNSKGSLPRKGLNYSPVLFRQPSRNSSEWGKRLTSADELRQTCPTFLFVCFHRFFLNSIQSRASYFNSRRRGRRIRCWMPACFSLFFLHASLSNWLSGFAKELEPFPNPHHQHQVCGHKIMILIRSTSEIKFLFTSVKDHVCECIRLGLGLLSTRRTYFPQVGGAKLSISSTSPALADDGFTDGGEEPSWRNRPLPVTRHSWDLLWGSWGVMNSYKHT